MVGLKTVQNGPGVERFIPSVTLSLNRASEGSPAQHHQGCTASHWASQVQDKVDSRFNIVKEVPGL